VKKEIIFTLMVLSIFFISACDVYNTLYIKQAEEGVEVPEGEIIVENVGMVGEETDTEEVSEESVEEEETELENVVEEVDIIIAEETDEGEVIPEDAIVILVEETDLVSLVPQAEDPDKDLLTFTFTSPISDNGDWQTTYGDSGEYTVTVSASDGSLTATKEVLIIVNRKEEAPVFNSFNPGETAVDVQETDTVTFKVDASDLNDDVLKYIWKLDGEDVGFGSSYNYGTTHDDAGPHTIKVTVSDGIFDTEKLWSVTVNNVNRKPVLETVGDIEVDETNIVFISLDAWDDDGDDLSYGIDDVRFEQDENSFEWKTTYDDAGEHIVTVTVSDGVDTTSQQVTITVENINRAPIILDIIQR
jgi:hypothetical protein